MAVRIRLKRLGRKKRPVYRIVVADSSSPRDGKVIENLGQYGPLEEPPVMELNEERTKYWLSVGAQPSETLERILHTKGISAQVERKSSNQGVTRKDRTSKAS